MLQIVSSVLCNYFLACFHNYSCKPTFGQYKLISTFLQSANMMATWPQYNISCKTQLSTHTACECLYLNVTTDKVKQKQA